MSMDIKAKHRRPEGYYLCPQCRQEMEAHIIMSPKYGPYQMNRCYDCRLQTGPVQRPDLETNA